jgi:hypothetical protein
VYRRTTSGAPNGRRSGLRITLDDGRNCITGVGTENSGWWEALQTYAFGWDALGQP